MGNECEPEFDEEYALRDGGSKGSAPSICSADELNSRLMELAEKGTVKITICARKRGYHMSYYDQLTKVAHFGPNLLDLVIAAEDRPKFRQGLAAEALKQNSQGES